MRLFAFFQNKYRKGFTIVEILVVTTIITVLVGIVLANVGNYRNKATNNSVKSLMGTLHTTGVIYYDNNGNYTNLFLDPIFDSAYSKIVQQSASLGGAWLGHDAINNPGGVVKNWCLCAPLSSTSDTPSGSTICIDSNGYKKVVLHSCVLPPRRCGFLNPNAGVCSD